MIASSTISPATAPGFLRKRRIVSRVRLDGLADAPRLPDPPAERFPAIGLHLAASIAAELMAESAITHSGSVDR